METTKVNRAAQAELVEKRVEALKEKKFEIGKCANMMKTATISEETRNILLVQATLMDTVDGLYQWLNKKYNNVSDDESDRIYDASLKLREIIDKYILESITDNLCSNDFKDV